MERSRYGVLGRVVFISLDEKNQENHKSSVLAVRDSKQIHFCCKFYVPT
jgi:hypothetical protein